LGKSAASGSIVERESSSERCPSAMRCRTIVAVIGLVMLPTRQVMSACLGSSVSRSETPKHATRGFRSGAEIMTLTPGTSSSTISPRTADPITSKLGQSLAGCIDTTGTVSCSRHTKKRFSIKSSVIFARPCAVWENVPRRRSQRHRTSAQCVILETPHQCQLRVETDSPQSESGMVFQHKVIAIVAIGRGGIR
jgi:hypothetical protein